jgi:hypothetical protein
MGARVSDLGALALVTRSRAVALVAAAAVAAVAPAARAQKAGAYDAAPAGLVHEAVTFGRRGSPITITVGVQNDLPFDKLVLAYRPAGESDFRGREMTVVTEGTYSAEIPVHGTAGATVEYYIEAQDKDGAPVAGRGSAQSPLVIELAGPAPLADGAKEGGEDDDADAPSHHLFVALLLGSGAGWARGNGDTNADTMIEPSRLARAGFGQLSPELGVWLSATFMVSLQGRFELVTGTTDVYADGRVYRGADYAAAGFLKGSWLVGGDAKIHPFFSLAAGYGQIRHVVTFDALTSCGPNHRETCVDTIATGPVTVGPGGGVLFDLGPTLEGVVEVDTQLTFPAYSLNVDVNFGVALKL